MGTEPLATFHRRLVGIRADLRLGRKRSHPLGLGLVPRSRRASDRTRGGTARISRFLPSERDKGLPSLPAFLRPDACVRVDRWSIFRPVHVTGSSSVIPRLRGMVGCRPPRSTPHPAGLGPIRGPLRKQSLVVHHRLHGANLADAVPREHESGFLLAVNFLGGVIWAGLALGLQNYVFDSVRPEDRAKAIALYSTVNAVGWSVGALLGSWLVEHLPSRIEWAGVILQPASNLPFVFFLSGVLRLLVSSSLLGTFHEARQVESVPRQQLLWELPLVRPVAQFVVWTLPKSNR